MGYKLQTSYYWLQSIVLEFKTRVQDLQIPDYKLQIRVQDLQIRVQGIHFSV